MHDAASYTDLKTRRIRKAEREINKLLECSTSMALPHNLLDSGHGLSDIFETIEGADANITLATLAETGPRRADDARAGQESVEEFPGVGLPVDPNVRGVLAADALVPHGTHGFTNVFGVIQITGNQFLYLRLAFGCVNGFGGALHGVGYAVEFGGVAAIPEGMYRDLLAGFGVGHAILGNDRIGAAGSGETGVLGKAPELDGHFPRAFYLEDGAWQIFVPDKGLVSGVVQDQGLVFLGVCNPFLQLRPRDGSAGGVVGETEIDEIHRLGGQVGNEVVFFCGVEINDPGVTTILETTCSSGHDIGVEIDGIDRVGNGDADIGGEEFLEIGAVALCAIADEDFVGGDVSAFGLKVFFSDDVPQEPISLLRSVAAKGGVVGHFVYRPVKRLNASCRQGSSDISDPEFDNIERRFGFLVGCHPLGDVGEEIGCLEFLEIFVDFYHR